MSSSSFLSAANLDYIAGIYQRFLADPASVEPDWADFFGNLGDEARALMAEVHGASWAPEEDKIQAVLSTSKAQRSNEGRLDQKSTAARAASPSLATQDARAVALDAVRALFLVRAYRTRGHLLAHLDPLGLSQRKYHPDLDPKTYGFTEADYDRPIYVDGLPGGDTATLREILALLQNTYSGSVGVEYMHIQNPVQRAWIQERIEAVHNQTDFTRDEKKKILSRLTAAEGFELFLQTKYTGTKRFGLEGGESFIPLAESVIGVSASLGVQEVVIGMAHRGRLNMLTNVMGKSFTAMFSEFQGTPAKPDDVQGSGDVKYHLGTSTDRDFDGSVVHLSLTANPSHLEAVNPVVLGKVRAKQEQRKDTDRSQVMGLLIHGDAALAGQGLVPESLMLSELQGYRTGGTMHIVINNQIGFTTAPHFSRSSDYCTDVAAMIQSPVFHVNADDVEAVVHVARIAAEFRQTFKKDVFIDMVCYRRQGHNEIDEPAFTQPRMYRVIREKPTTRQIYAEKLVAEGTLTPDEADKIYQDFNAHLESEFKAATSYKPKRADMLEGKWTGFRVAPGDYSGGMTALGKEVAQKVGRALTTVPKDFNLNSKIARQLEAKKKMFAGKQGFDWATAEALAYGSLALEGHPVRLSGQDSGRGTFSQRHAVLVDQEDETIHIPLDNIDPAQARFEVHDSPLSEAAVLGYEYGYSTAEPHGLTLWEGQFGDFVNGAQVMIDQFISSAETKWLRMSGLVLLLPHGMEGQGPEHSSARLERFLQNSAEDNWQIVNTTTPANFFHVLRRQIHRDFRKPLVVMTPKSLLRHKLCVSSLEDMTGASTFARVLPDVEVDAKKVKRIVLCSGKVYYDLYEARQKKTIDSVALVRLEQLYPFPTLPLAEELAKYPNADVVWCQEEPENQGAWSFVDRRIEEALAKAKHKTKRPFYVGRVAAASPATGSLKTHIQEQEYIVEQALTLKGK